MGMTTIHLRQMRPCALCRRIVRWVSGALACAGAGAVAMVALQFTQLPWKAYSSLSCDGNPGANHAGTWMPTHILVLGGSGVPGESGLIRLWYAADAARKYPGVPVWMALPCSAGTSENPAAAVYAAELQSRGVEAERCEPRACGNNTREQAVALVRDLADGDAGGAWRVLLVTSPEHVRRACLAVRRVARDAGADIEVRGLAAQELSLEDHVREAKTPIPDPPSNESGAPDPPSSGLPGTFRYEFWNHAKYTLDVAREGSAILYYWLRGWI